MIALLLGLAGLFLLACLIYWWARGGVVPAIMLTLALVPVCAIGMVVVHDKPTGQNQLDALLCFGALAALAWLPRLRRICMGSGRRVVVAQAVAIRVQ